MTIKDYNTIIHLKLPYKNYFQLYQNLTSSYTKVNFTLTYSNYN